MIDFKNQMHIAGPEQPPQHSSFQLDDQEGSGGGMSLVQILNIVRAYVWLSAGIFVALVALAFVVIKFMPKSYVATATLIVNSDNSDPLAGKNQLGVTFTFFPTQVQLINNSVILGPVVDRLKLQNDPDFNSGFVGDPKTLKDVVLENLRTSINVQQGEGSELLYISATSRDPVKAAEIANAVADEYLLHVSRRSKAPAIERANRYSEQLAELKEKVDAAQTKVDEFRRVHAMADLNQVADTEGAALSDLQTKLLQAQNERRLLEGRQESPEAVASRNKLEQLDAQMAQLRATLGPQHPKILQLQSEIDATKKTLDENLSIRLEKIRQLENTYQAAVTAERNRLLERRDVQDQGAKLLLELQLARDTYAQALRGQDQVQFASAGNYNDFSLVSRAEPPVKSTKPNKAKLFLVAIMGSLFCALGGPFAYELLLNRRIRCRDDLERHFHIMTLAEFDHPREKASA